MDLTNTQEVDLSVVVTNRLGGPATVESPEWFTSNSEVVGLTPSGLSCLVKSIGPVGTATVTFQADADLGAGVTPISGTIDINVTPAAAQNVAIIAGAAREQA